MYVYIYLIYVSVYIYMCMYIVGRVFANGPIPSSIDEYCDHSANEPVYIHILHINISFIAWLYVYTYIVRVYI